MKATKWNRYDRVFAALVILGPIGPRVITFNNWEFVGYMVILTLLLVTLWRKSRQLNEGK